MHLRNECANRQSNEGLQDFRSIAQVRLWWRIAVAPILLLALAGFIGHLLHWW